MNINKYNNMDKFTNELDNIFNEMLIILYKYHTQYALILSTSELKNIRFIKSEIHT